MPRTILGKKLDKFTLARHAALAAVAVAVPDIPTPAKIDVEPAFRTMDLSTDPIKVEFDLPAYDLATHNKLVTLTVVVVPVGHGEPTDPEAWLASSYLKGTADTSAIQAGGPVEVTVAGLPDGDFVGQILLTYDA